MTYPGGRPLSQVLGDLPPPDPTDVIVEEGDSMFRTALGGLSWSTLVIAIGSIVLLAISNITF